MNAGRRATARVGVARLLAVLLVALAVLAMHSLDAGHDLNAGSDPTVTTAQSMTSMTSAVPGQATRPAAQVDHGLGDLTAVAAPTGASSHPDGHGGGHGAQACLALLIAAVAWAAITAWRRLSTARYAATRVTAIVSVLHSGDAIRVLAPPLPALGVLRT